MDMKNHKPTEVENMTINILSEGAETIWNLIEKCSNPLERCRHRKIYGLAIKEIEKL